MSVAFYIWIMIASVGDTVAFIWLCAEGRRTADMARLAVIALCWPLLLVAVTFVALSRGNWVRSEPPRVYRRPPTREK